MRKDQKEFSIQIWGIFLIATIILLVAGLYTIAVITGIITILLFLRLKGE